MNYYRLSSDAIFAIKQPMTRTLELLLDVDEDTQVMPEYPMTRLMHTPFEISGEEITPKPFDLVMSNPPPVSCGLSVGFINHLSKLMNYCLLTQTNINDVMKQMRFYVDATHTLELTDEYFDWFNSIVEKRHELGTLGMKQQLEGVEVVSVSRSTDNEKKLNY